MHRLYFVTILCLGLLAASLPGETVELVPIRAELIEPFGVAFDDAGNLYVCEHKGERVMRLSPSGEETRFAGTGEVGYSGDGGPAERAMLHDPHAIVIGDGQQLYIADTRNSRIRKVDLASRQITTIAGNGEDGFSGDGGPAISAAFNGIYAIALDAVRRKLYAADLHNIRVRVIDLNTGLVATLAGNGEKGVPADGAVAAGSPLADPRAVAVAANGDVYILERGGNALRVVNSEGRIRTLIRPGGITPDLKGPKHLAVDHEGAVIIADAENHLIRRYTPADGKTVTIAGTGASGDRIVPDDPLRTGLNRPHGVFIHPSGDLYISDSYNHRVLKLAGQ